MTTVAANSSGRQLDFGTSRWAQVAAVLLLGLAVAVIGFGLYLVWQGVTYDDAFNMGYGVLATAIGTAVLIAGVAHLIAGMYVWRHRTWARVLGIVIAVLGGLLAITVLPTAFYPVLKMGVGGQILDAGPELRSVLIGLSIVPYVLIVVGLVLGGRHFRRPHEA